MHIQSHSEQFFQYFQKILSSGISEILSETCCIKWWNSKSYIFSLLLVRHNVMHCAKYFPHLTIKQLFIRMNMINTHKFSEIYIGRNKDILSNVISCFMFHISYANHSTVILAQRYRLPEANILSIGKHIW